MSDGKLTPGGRAYGDFKAKFMKIKDLVKGLKVAIDGNPETEISGIVYDSRDAYAGCLFAALHGTREEGKKYIGDAAAKGAAAVLTDDSGVKAGDLGRAITLLACDDVSETLGEVSSKFFGSPSASMKIFAVTGTNGKTTITYLLEEIFKGQSVNLGVIGTISYRYGPVNIPAPNTTPQSSDLHRILRQMKDLGADGAAMEVSSHGLVQGRISGCDIDAAIFTNLTREHLDYHKTMEEYKNAKSLLFEKYLAKSAKKDKFSVINLDDPCGKELVNTAAGGIITYGINSDARIKASGISAGRDGTDFTMEIEGRKMRVRTKLVGTYNIYNILAAAGCAFSQNADMTKVAESIEKFRPAPGRFETINAGQPFTAIVDYAHTPDALENILSAVRAIEHGKIITVFGCGGDRDRSKRPLMGEISCRLSDYTVITSDNPRSENPERIALDVEVGFQRIKCQNYEVIIDRAKAIEKAIGMCGTNDILVVAGKGHEDYQIIGEKKIHFSDRETLTALLAEKYGKNETLKLVGRYWKETYHSPFDEYHPETDDLSGIVEDAKLLFHVGTDLANSSEWPAWNKNSEFKTIRDQSRK